MTLAGSVGALRNSAPASAYFLALLNARIREKSRPGSFCSEAGTAAKSTLGIGDALGGKTAGDKVKLAVSRRGKRLELETAALDRAQGLTLSKQACEAKDAAGCSSQAAYVAGGELVPRDEKQAVALLERSCELGSSRGCYNAGSGHANGFGVPRSDAQALAFYRKGCARKDPECCAAVGMMLAAGRGAARRRRKNARRDGGSGNLPATVFAP